MPQNSILNYFSKTPKSSPSAGPSGSGGVVKTPSPAKKTDEKNGKEESPSTPTSRPKPGQNQSKRGASKAEVSVNSASRNKKRPPSMELTIPKTANGTSSKRPKTDDGSPGKKDFTEGTLVWAKLEGYPWWPGFVRAEKTGLSYLRNDSNEFHVQFFDNPPSRAWIRKADMKLYQGSGDGAVPPARSDPDWIKACKTADSGLDMSPKKRVEKFWVDFNGHDESNDGEVVEVAEVSKLKEKDKVKNGTPNTNDTAANKRRRRNIIDSESSGEGSDNEPIVTKKSKDIVQKNNEPTKAKVSQNKDKNSDEEYKPDSSIETVASEEEDEDVSEIESVIESDDDVVDITPPDKKKKTANKRVSETPKSTTSAGSSRTPARQIGSIKSTSLAFSKSPQVSTYSSDEGRWPHLKLKWLKPEFIKDRQLRGQSHSDYDPRTLHVPSSFLETLTPAVRQWWEMKSLNFDCILFFKLGKFYEMYHMDAVTGVEELGLIFMKGDLAHCGFPEAGYSRYSEILVEKGYKVARIEQTETPDMMIDRCKKQFKPTKFEKVVKREICQYTTQGVRVASVQDFGFFKPNAEYLYAIIEKQEPNGPTEYGVCFIDTTIGTFNIGQFNDDRHCSRLRTLLSHYAPIEILHEKKIKGSMSETAMQLLNNLSGIRKNGLNSETEFFSAEKTLKVLAEGTYFRKTQDDPVEWPEGLKQFQSEDDNMGLTPKSGWDLGIKCLGAVIYYLTQCLVEHDLLSLKQFEQYVPVDSVWSETEKLADETNEQKRRSKFMVLDAVTLRNLEITHGPKSLLSLLDRCCTPFGKRLLRQWVCAPLATASAISERQDAIEQLMTLQELKGKVTPILRTLVDLERLLSKFHSLGSKHHSKDHPDARAIMFEEKKYSKRKISDLTTTLKNFKSCVAVINLMKGESDITTKVLLSIITEFPQLDDLLKRFDTSFNHKTALEEGKIIPLPGLDKEFDAACAEIQELTDESNSYLKGIQRKYHQQVKYFGSEKKRFQLEIPDTVKVSNEFEMSSNRKGYKRYYTVKTREFLAKMIQLETTRDSILKDMTRRIFEQFDDHRNTWKKAVSCIATLDVLISLSIFSENHEDMCRPLITETASVPFMKIEDGRHPALSHDTYIPNDSNLGKYEDDNSGAFLLLTGPNMGGKSTLMRQIGVIAVLAQIGVHVPATKCEMSIVDRIFTRLGANDNLGSGESTFFVELSETSAVLQHSTQDSLVLMDELGRGTATYDGTSIAYAVAHALAARNCRTIFSTHYHNLVESLQNLPGIQLGHMACMVENENEDDPTEETITFLYKLAPGACPKSYGFNAAKLAGIPDSVIRLASVKALELERNVKRVAIFRSFCNDIPKRVLTLAEVRRTD